MLTDKRYRLFKLCLRGMVGMAEYNTACMLDLVIEKFSEILHVHLAFVHINHNGIAVKHSVNGINRFYCAYDIAELSHA